MKRALQGVAMCAAGALLLAVFASFAIVGAAFALPVSHR